MFPYLIRIAIWLALLLTIIAVMMPGLGQMNPRRDWIVYWAGQPGPETFALHDLERHFSAPILGIPFIYWMDFSTQGQLAYAAAADGQTEVRVFDVRSSVNNSQTIYISPTRTQFFRFEWSPDGRYLAFIEMEDARIGTLYIWDSTSIINIYLPEPDVGIETMRWSANNQLAFVGRFPGQQGFFPFPSELYLWDGQQTTNLSQTPDRDESIGPWSQNGHLAYISQKLGSDDLPVVMVWDGLKSSPTFSGFSEVRMLEWNAGNELTLSGTYENNVLPQLYQWHQEQVIHISPGSDPGYVSQTWSRDGRWAVAVIYRTGGSPESIQVQGTNQQILLDATDAYDPVWTEAGSLLFCQQQPQGLLLQNWDGQRVRPVTQEAIIYTIVPNATYMYCN